MKICPKCHRQPSDQRLLKCERCQVSFVEETELFLRSLSNDDLKYVAKKVVWSWHFWVPFLIAMAVACVAIFKFVGSAAKKEAQARFHNEVEKQVKAMLDQPGISNIMVAVATSEASHLMSDAIQPRLDTFDRNLSNKMSSIDANITTVQLNLSNETDRVESIVAGARTNLDDVKQLTDLYTLTLKSQGDDIKAFWTLYTMMEKNTNNPNRFLAKAVANAVLENATLREQVYTMFRPQIQLWEGSTNKAETATFTDFLSKFNQTSARLDTTLLLDAFFAQERFPLAERMRIVSEIATKSQSLFVVSHACILMNRHAHIGKNVLGLNEYLAWYQNCFLKTNVPAEPVEPEKSNR